MPGFSLWREAERQGTARGSPGMVEGWDGHLPVLAISPQEDLAEGRAHGLLQRGLLPSPGDCSSLRHCTSRVLRGHRGVPAGPAPQAPGLALPGLPVPRPLQRRIHPRVRHPCPSMSQQQHKGFGRAAKGPGAHMGRLGRERVPSLPPLEPAPPAPFTDNT